MDGLDERGWTVSISGGVLKADAQVVVTVHDVTAASEKESLVRGTAQASDLFKAGRLWPKEGTGSRSRASGPPAPVDDDALPGYAVVITGEVHDKADNQQRLLGQVDARFGSVRAASPEAAIARAAAALGRQLQAEVFHVTSARAERQQEPRQPQLPLAAARAAQALHDAGAIMEVPSDVDTATGEVVERKSRRRPRSIAELHAGPTGDPS